MNQWIHTGSFIRSEYILLVFIFPQFPLNNRKYHKYHRDAQQRIVLSQAAIMMRFQSLQKESAAPSVVRTGCVHKYSARKVTRSSWMVVAVPFANPPYHHHLLEPSTAVVLSVTLDSARKERNWSDMMVPAAVCVAK